MMAQGRLFHSPSLWDATLDGDRRALRLYERHYSAREYADGRARRLFVGPGEKMVLLTPACDALFAWRLFRSDDTARNGADGRGLNCAVFRNESAHLSSRLILDAERHAAARWGPRHAYTYVNEAATERRRSGGSPAGACFIHAGWSAVGRTRSGLVTLEKHIAPEVDYAVAEVADRGPVPGTLTLTIPHASPSRRAGEEAPDRPVPSRKTGGRSGFPSPEASGVQTPA